MFDISHPRRNKPTMTTAEIDDVLDDRTAHEALKRQLLEDVAVGLPRLASRRAGLQPRLAIGRSTPSNDCAPSRPHPSSRSSNGMATSGEKSVRFLATDVVAGAGALSRPTTG
jgi:hypothetical protein